ncbi:hypothetical protein BD413DRAFT_580397 [Trametes elegans]|nr:hypothetical protein BD413DRAFT_580397 [Trametes elegans]
MNQWLDCVPQHCASHALSASPSIPLTCAAVRWDPDREDRLFFAQLAYLYADLYQVQIGAFITSRRGHTLALASLVICTIAARSCVRMLEKVTKRLGNPTPANASSLLCVGLVLVMNMWGQKRSQQVAGAAKDLEFINSCIHMLSLFERE